VDVKVRGEGNVADLWGKLRSAGVLAGSGCAEAFGGLKTGLVVFRARDAPIG